MSLVDSLAWCFEAKTVTTAGLQLYKGAKGVVRQTVTPLTQLVVVLCAATLLDESRVLEGCTSYVQSAFAAAFEDKVPLYLAAAGMFMTIAVIVGIVFDRRMDNLVLRRRYGLNIGVHNLSNAEQSEVQGKCKALLKPHRFAQGGDQFRLLEDVTTFIPGIEPNDFMLTCDAEHTRKYRSLIHNTLFSATAIDELTSKTHAYAQNLVQGWIANEYGPGQQTSLYPQYRQYVLSAFIDMLCNPVGESDIDPLTRQELMEAFEIVHQAPESDSESAVETLVNRVGEIEGSLIHTMRQSNYRVQAIKAMLLILRSAALDNTIPIIERALRHCARQPKITQIAKGDIESIMAAESMSFQEAIAASPEIRKILHEALRTSHPVSLVERDLHPHVVAVRTLAKMPGLVGEHPKKFRPQRFDAIRGGSPKFWPSVPWLGLGHGVHVCPGWKFSAVTAGQLLGVFVCTP